MKNNKLIILLLFVFTSVFSQEKLNTAIPTDSIKTTTDSLIAKVNRNKWSIEVGTGVSNGTMPYTEGYHNSMDNQLFKGFIFNCYTVGASYKFSEIVGLKMDMGFNRFSNDPETKSKPFELAQYRASIQALLNLNSFIRPVNYVSRSNVLFHAGLNLAIMYPIAVNDEAVVYKDDVYGGIVLGITPILKVSKKTSIFLDVSSYNNYLQTLAWDGQKNPVGNSKQGHMYSVTFGLSFALDANKK
jgi:OOP family OmpA-OmpF porin